MLAASRLLHARNTHHFPIPTICLQPLCLCVTVCPVRARPRSTRTTPGSDLLRLAQLPVWSGCHRPEIGIVHCQRVSSSHIRAESPAGPAGLPPPPPTVALPSRVWARTRYTSCPGQASVVSTASLRGPARSVWAEPARTILFSPAGRSFVTTIYTA
jgi:hypothetical protein